MFFVWLIWFMFSYVAFVLHIASRKKWYTLFNKIMKKPHKTSTAYIIVWACVYFLVRDIKWWENACGHNSILEAPNTMKYLKVQVVSTNKIETRSAVLMKKKKTTTSVHITGYNTLALYFCVSMFGHGDERIQTYTHTRTHTHLQTLLRTCHIVK